MTYEHALNALGDPTRRAIVATLRRGPQSVGKLGQILPVSRPAVSQHLKVLSEAGLVESEPRGNKRIYRLSPDGINTLRTALDALWTDALKSLEDKARNIANEEKNMIEPIEKNLQLPISPSRAFDLFTSEMATWWPVATHSLSAGSGNIPISLDIDGHVGGQVMETLFDGSKRPWGRITAWNPPNHFAMTWHVGRPEEEATHIAVTFEESAQGCSLTLIHDQWEGFGASAAGIRENYRTGWDLVLGEYANRAA